MSENSDLSAKMALGCSIFGGGSASACGETPSAPFTYMHSPAFGTNDRWIAHDQDQSFAGEFRSEEAARSATERWNANNGDSVAVSFRNGPGRGTYTVSVQGTTWRRSACGNFGMEEASRIAGRLRNAIAEYGIETVMAILDAAHK